MLTNYIDLLPEWGGYLTEKEKIHPKRFEQFIYHLAVYEEEHFKRRGYEENEPGWKLSADNEQNKHAEKALHIKSPSTESLVKVGRPPYF